MPCWVVPSVASEIWHVPLEQVIDAVRKGQIPSKNENGFTFIDVAPQTGVPVQPIRSLPQPIAYRVPKARRNPGEEPIPLPRPAEVITPLEMHELHGESAATPDRTPGSMTSVVGSDDDAPEPLSMGDWRRGRRTAAQRRTPPR
jgi:hypothetical protein